MADLDRKYAWRNVKSAVRSYAKDPTPQHAEQVENAWKAIRRMETVSHWREWPARRFETGKSSRQSSQTG